VSRRYALLAVEGPTDQAAVCKALRLLGYDRFGGDVEKLDSFWRDEARIVPTYPPRRGNLYARLPMPSILSTEARSIAVYSGGGSTLAKHVRELLRSHDLAANLEAFGVIADADKLPPADVAGKYRAAFAEVFPDFPAAPGAIIAGPPRLGAFVLPDNVGQGVVEHLVLECGDAVYAAHLERGREFVRGFSDAERQAWDPFDEQKAIVAAVASLLRPGKSNAVTIEDNLWISEQTRNLPKLAGLLAFLQALVPPA
jgi:hypothetical protein